MHQAAVRLYAFLQGFFSYFYDTSLIVFVVALAVVYSGPELDIFSRLSLHLLSVGVDPLYVSRSWWSQVCL